MFDEEVSKKIKEYEYLPCGKELLEYINNIIFQKGDSWDKGLTLGTQDLTCMLLFEYARGLEIVTGGRVTSQFVIDKLNDLLGKIRYGNFKAGLDDEVTYGNIKKDGIIRPLSVTEEQYIVECRVKRKIGAHAPNYTNQNGKRITALVLFDSMQKLSDGTTLSGIDFSNLNDIRHTFFHELTHVMGKNLVKIIQLREKELVYKNGKNGSTYINYLETADKDGLDYYLQSINDTLGGLRDNVQFSGISTIEINPKKSKNRIMRNQIDEGATELIARLIMQTNGFSISEENKDRYGVQVEIIRRVFENRGIEKSITEYVTFSNTIISYLESLEVGNDDFLHLADDFVHANNDIERNLIANVDKTINYEKMQKAFSMIGLMGLSKSQKQWFKYKLMQRLLEKYTGSAEKRTVFVEKARSMIDFADRFGEALDTFFPIKEKNENIRETE